MRRSRAAVLVAVLLGILAVVHPAFAGQPWDPGNGGHAEAIHAFACDPDFFPTMSNGAVKGSSATPSDLVKFLARQGIDISEADAATVLTETELTIKGRNPKKIPASDLVTARKPGSTGLHGHFAEIDFVKSNSGYVNYSSDGSATTDATVRNASGKVLKYCQVKCRNTAASSLEGVVENWLKFHAKDRGGEAEFLGVIPKDQFDELVKTGKIAPDGTVLDRDLIAEIEAKIAAKVEKDSYGAKNQQLLKDGLAAKKVHSLKLAPLPKTHSEYTAEAKAHQENSTKAGAPLKKPTVTARNATAVAGYGGAAALALIYLAQARDMKTALIASGDSTLSVLEQARDFSGRQKYQVQRALRAIPRWLRPSMPKVSSIRIVGRWAAQAGAVVAVGLIAVDAYRYANGTISAREFTGSSSQMAVGVAAGWAGAKVGMALGASIGSVIPGAGTAIGGAVGAFVGGVMGGIAGGFVAGAAVDAVWASFDAEEREYAIELIRERYRAMRSDQSIVP